MKPTPIYKANAVPIYCQARTGRGKPHERGCVNLVRIAGELCSAHRRAMRNAIVEACIYEDMAHDNALVSVEAQPWEDWSRMQRERIRLVAEYREATEPEVHP